ncbi:MAG: VapC toxin family PIN domain ribonuclease [Sphingomonadales bacterium 32-68-7]|nr:MAG: VapC toxin family PIN domain ribonuclease [Sphingomonadales bacterium 12-68-11]OYX09524.1 MAG: VapC toxin family PIN domain ribonuclease [Sphingomonadales bacterium 32-68-7]
MILIDSSVWIDHIRAPLPALAALLSEQRVVQHPFVTGEVALGSMANRERIIAMLAALPQAERADDDQFLAFVETRRIFGTGLGFVDCQLLISATVLGGTVWSTDKRLARQAERLGLAYQP